MKVPKIIVYWKIERTLKFLKIQMSQSRRFDVQGKKFVRQMSPYKKQIEKCENQH